MAERPNAELLPCPFCGGRNIGITYIRDGWKTTCGCGASGKSCFHGPLDQPSSEERAITAWNTRHEPRPNADDLANKSERDLAYAWECADRLAEALEAITSNTYVGQHHKPVNTRSRYGNYFAAYYHNGVRALAAYRKERGR